MAAAETTTVLTTIEAVALIGTLGLGAQWLAWRLQLPAIVLMAAAGLIVGPLCALAFGHPLLEPSETFGDLMRPMISIAVAIILFEGGLVLKWSDLRDSGAAVRRLVFIGAPVAWVLGTLVCYFIAGLGLGTSILFAGILVVTGPTVIMPLLRQSKLGGRVGKSLKWEGIINDPVGVLFAVGAFEVLRVIVAGESALGVLGWIAFAVLIGVVLGVGSGYALSTAFRKAWIPEFLKAPIILAAVLACFAISESIEHETGLVAVTAFGMTLGNSRFAALQEMKRFKENIAVILISGVFVMLTADLTPSVMAQAIGWQTLGFLIGMLLIVRPLQVWLSTLGEFNWREAALVGWIAPRGIVAVAISGFFANRMVALQSETGSDLLRGAEQMIPLAFAIVFVTVIAHGFTIRPLAQLLKLAKSGPAGVLIVGANPWSSGLAKVLKDAGVGVVIADTDLRRLRPARELGITAFTGEVLSEAAELRLDHALFSKVVAASPNDDRNSLVCSHFGPELGRDAIFQLSSGEKDVDLLGVREASRGKHLIRKGRNYDGLVRDHYRNYVFAKTELSDVYTLETFLKHRPDADLIAEVRKDGECTFLNDERQPKGEAGNVIISFGPDVSAKDSPRTEPIAQPPSDPDLP